MKTLEQLNAEELAVQQEMLEYEAYERTLSKLTNYTSNPEHVTLNTPTINETFEFDNGYFVHTIHASHFYQNLLIGKNGTLLPNHPLNHPECDIQRGNPFRELMNKIRELKA